MMANLLSQELKVLVHILIGLPKYRIEWLCQSVGGTLVLRHIKSAYIDHSEGGILTLVCLQEEVLVLHDFRALLDHADGLIEPDWDGNFG